MAVNKALMEIQKECWTAFQVGDIVQCMDADNSIYLGMVISKSNPNIINLFTLREYEDLKYSFCGFSHVEAFKLIKLFSVTQELISFIRKGVELIYPHPPQMDNLTYIEILARLREYERTTQPQ